MGGGRARHTVVITRDNPDERLGVTFDDARTPSNAPQVVLAGMEVGGIAYRSGKLCCGDKIQSINGNPIHSVGDVAACMGAVELRFVIIR